MGYGWQGPHMGALTDRERVLVLAVMAALALGVGGGALIRWVRRRRRPPSSR